MLVSSSLFKSRFLYTSKLCKLYSHNILYKSISKQLNCAEIHYAYLNCNKNTFNETAFLIIAECSFLQKTSQRSAISQRLTRLSTNELKSNPKAISLISTPCTKSSTNPLLVTPRPRTSTTHVTADLRRSI